MCIIHSTCIKALLAALIAQVSADGNTGDLIEKLQSPKTTAQASNEIISICRTGANPCTTLRMQLPALLLKTTELSVVQSEAQLAGILSVRSAIPALATLLDRPNVTEYYHTINSHMEMQGDPVARALYAMGEASVTNVSLQLQSQNASTRDRAIRLLLLINTDASREALRKHLLIEDDVVLRKMMISNGIGK